MFATDSIVVVENRLQRAHSFALGLQRNHPGFASSVDDLPGHTTGGPPLITIAGDVAH
jgi:hypothetical protein